MQTDEDRTVALASDGLSWAIVTARWLRGASAGGQVVELDADAVRSLLMGLSGITEILTDFLRCPGVLPPRTVAAVPVERERPALRVIEGGAVRRKSRKAELVNAEG